ncbi:hypothetical protein LP420_33755 [Massilia sp. B-10]|nr:hypothetical protein LP420_33755 [Massilia sp. B-10]
MAVKRRNVSLGEFIERFTRVVKMPHPELRPASLADIMDDILWLNREPCKSRGIEIGWLRRDDVPLQRLDSHLMEQALLNIVKNAVEAVRNHPGRKRQTGHHPVLAVAGRRAGAPGRHRFGQPPRRSLKPASCSRRS